MLGEVVSVDVKLPAALDAEVRVRGDEDELDNAVDWENVPGSNNEQNAEPDLPRHELQSGIVLRSSISKAELVPTAFE